MALSGCGTPSSEGRMHSRQRRSAAGCVRLEGIQAHGLNALELHTDRFSAHHCAWRRFRGPENGWTARSSEVKAPTEEGPADVLMLGYSEGRTVYPGDLLGSMGRKSGRVSG